MPQKNSKPLTVRFPTEMRQAVAGAARERGLTDGMLVKTAVAAFLHGGIGSVSSTPPDGPTAEPSLANTEQGFALGVEAACERIAKSARLGVKMATGVTMGEDLAHRIKLDLLGG